MDLLNDLTVFARVAEQGSFTAAAESLRLSKSAVSKQVARLEARLGSRLLTRTTRRLTLTETGRVVLDHAERALAEAQAAEAAVQNLQTAPRGLLRVNMPMSFGLSHVAPLLPEFLAAYPELRVEVSLNDRRVDLLEEDVDVAIRIGDLRDSTLAARRLAPIRGVVCAAPSYIERFGAPKTPDELKWHHCLIYTYLPEPDIWRFSDGSAVRVNGPMRANNGDVLLQAARGGLGIVRLPSFLCGNDLADGALVPLLEEYRLPDSGVHAVYPAGRHMTPKLRAFIDFLATRFNAGGIDTPWDCRWIHLRQKVAESGLPAPANMLKKRRSQRT
ncbi:LysR family transcriptional regulator [Ferrovibrio sp.]|uniref:LysR family transcriptional regulator n=1 Tax=Ferrovibrio sp. TaxID=1917215 RepID=UPI0025C0250D|nr:LysR family transcriptional regulator [Ferrovibrio sp.]MBX3453167.1 LysR family transcriptional regulator [Ferrovibrio sp.]